VFLAHEKAISSHNYGWNWLKFSGLVPDTWGLAWNQFFEDICIFEFFPADFLKTLSRVS
jgi:hypothetical protein